MKYKMASDEMMQMVRDLVAKYHKRLDGASIAVLTKDKATKSMGSIVIGTASKVPSKVEPILDDHYDFMIVIAMDKWADMGPSQRVALIDHELCHCVLSDGEAKMRHHDYEEFSEIIDRHGFWRKDYGETAVQNVLFDQGVKVGTIKKRTK